LLTSSFGISLAPTKSLLTRTQGPVYSKVIDAVCEQSQVDFEEGGIDQGTLELLKSVCRIPTTADHFLSCESIKCFLLSPMFQNSKGDELRSTLPAMLADMVAKSERCKGD
jgi:hypothetical protein